MTKDLEDNSTEHAEVDCTVVNTLHAVLAAGTSSRVQYENGKLYLKLKIQRDI